MRTFFLLATAIAQLRNGNIAYDENGNAFKLEGHKVYRLKVTKPAKKAYTRVLLCNSSVDTLTLTGAETAQCIEDYYKAQYNGTIIYRKCGAKDSKGNLLNYGDEGFKDSARKTIVWVAPVQGALQGTRDPFLFEVTKFDELSIETQAVSEPIEEVKISKVVDTEEF